MGEGSDMIFPNVTSLKISTGENTEKGDWWGDAGMEQGSYGLRLAAEGRHVTGEKCICLFSLIFTQNSVSNHCTGDQLCSV